MAAIPVAAPIVVPPGPLSVPLVFELDEDAPPSPIPNKKKFKKNKSVVVGSDDDDTVNIPFLKKLKKNDDDHKSPEPVIIAEKPKRSSFDSFMNKMSIKPKKQKSIHRVPVAPVHVPVPPVVHAPVAPVHAPVPPVVHAPVIPLAPVVHAPLAPAVPVPIHVARAVLDADVVNDKYSENGPHHRILKPLEGVTVCADGTGRNQCVSFRDRANNLQSTTRFPTHRNQSDDVYMARVENAVEWLTNNNVRVTNEHVRMLGISSRHVNKFHRLFNKLKKTFCF